MSSARRIQRAHRSRLWLAFNLVFIALALRFSLELIVLPWVLQGSWHQLSGSIAQSGRNQVLISAPNSQRGVLDEDSSYPRNDFNLSIHRSREIDDEIQQEDNSSTHGTLENPHNFSVVAPIHSIATTVASISVESAIAATREPVKSPEIIDLSDYLYNLTDDPDDWEEDESSSTTGCHPKRFKHGAKYFGGFQHLLNHMLPSSPTAVHCCRACEAHPDCTHWTWVALSNVCQLQQGKLRLLQGTQSVEEVYSNRVKLDLYVERINSPAVLLADAQRSDHVIAPSAAACEYDPEDAPFFQPPAGPGDSDGLGGR